MDVGSLPPSDELNGGIETSVQSFASTSGSGTSQAGSDSGGSSVQEEEIDRILRKEDGKIYRKRNDQL